MDKDVLPDAIAELTPSDFYDTAHYNIFKAIVDLYEKKITPDIVTVTGYLKDKGILDSIGIGGPAYVAGLVTGTIHSSNIYHYINIIKEKATLRKIRLLLQSIGDKLNSCTDVEELLSETESKFMDIHTRKSDSKAEKVSDIAIRSMKVIEERAQQNSRLIGLPSGLRDLDYRTLGFQDKQLTIIGGRPSKGKSALGLNIAAYLSMYKDIPVAFFSLEDSKERIVSRIFASQSRVDSRRVRLGTMNPDEFSAVAQTVAELSSAPLYIADKSYLSIHELNRTARKLKKTHDIKILFIDYLQLMTGEKDSNREREISSISHSLKALAKELSIPVIALAQLHRVGIQGNRKPKLSDFRESGAIEQDADVGILLHRPNIEKALRDDWEVMNLIIAKQKDGPTGEISVLFHKKYMRFDNYDEDIEELE